MSSPKEETIFATYTFLEIIIIMIITMIIIILTQYAVKRYRVKLFYKNKEKQIINLKLSRSYSSTKELLGNYTLYCEESEKKKYYNRVLIELEKAISEDDIENFKKLSTLIDYTSDLVSKETLRDCYDNIDNPIRNTNLVILASKHNGINILKYLLDSDSELLNNLSVAIGKASISPKDEDEVHHNAFYYAIRSENIQLLDTLITNKFFKNYFASHSEELEEILSENYEELKLKNVPLSDEMQYFVVHKLLDYRFISTELNSSFNTDDHPEIKERIELLFYSINWLGRVYSNRRKANEEFLYVVKFIARNIHILKRRLKSTYDKIPWEEMEFCLVIFISSRTSIEKLNLFYRTILNVRKIINYLKDFTDQLMRIKNDKPEIIFDNKITTFDEFHELRNDYYQIRDIYSLKRINDHVRLALSINLQENQGQFMIIWTLQVIGQHLKNIEESPMVSHNTSELLMVSLSENARNIIIKLQDVISHADLLSKIKKIEENADDSFFINILKDIKNLGEVITDILYENRIKTIRLLFNKVIDSENPDEIKEILEELRTAKLDTTITHTYITLQHEKLKNVIKELSGNIVDKTNYENELFNKINSIINSSDNQIENVKFDYLMGYSDLQAFNVELNYHNYTVENRIKKIKTKANRVLNSITARINPKGLNKIGQLSDKIFKIVKSRNNEENLEEVERLTTQINFIVTFKSRIFIERTKLTERLNESTIKKKIKLSDNKFNNPDAQLHQLLSILNENPISVIKNNEKRCELQNNILFLDNYLAHDNSLADVLLSDPLIAVILNAQKCNIMECKLKYGKLLIEDSAKLWEKFYQDLDIIIDKDIMFDASENGNLDQLKDCLKKGADIKARSSVNSWTTLHFAAKGSSLKVIRFILDQNLSVNVKDNSGETPLHIAAAYGEQNIVNFFLTETDICVDVRNKKGETPLHVAARNGHKDIVENLLNNKADICTLDTRGFSPVYYAISNNSINVAKILLRKDLIFDIIDGMRGWTALHVAAHEGHLTLVNFLLQSGANINAATDSNEVPLHLAIYNGHLKVVNELIRYGADVNTRVINGWMPLHYAIQNGNVEMVNILLTNGAHVNTSNNTPLHIAAQFGYLEIVIALFNHGADIHSRCDDDFTPLHYAARNGHKEVVQFLIEKGTKINSTGNNNFSALHGAVTNHHKDVVKLLIKCNAQVNAQSIEGIAAIHLASRKGNKDIIDVLIKNTAEVNIKCNKSRTPLHFAIEEEQKGAVDFLIKNEADVNIRDNDGLTPLHIAVLHDNKNIVKLLIKNKAQVNREFYDDSTPRPLHMAAQAGHKEIVNILVKAGANINDRILRTNLAPLHYAIRYNHKEVVKVLTERRANVNAEDTETWSLPLIAGYTDIVEILLENKAYDFNYKDSHHFTPLHMAAIGGHKEIVYLLLRYGAHVNTISINNETPLLCAAQAGFAEIVQLLLYKGARVNFEYIQDITPLHVAASIGHSKVVEILLDMGANIDVNDNRQKSPLRLAVTGGHLQVVKILLEHMKVHIIDAQDADGFTLLHIASQGTNLELVKYLVDKGSDINARTLNGYKAIHVAARNGFKEAVEFFVSKGLSFNEFSTHDETPLHCAATRGQLEVVKYLIEQHADVNAKETANGFTPMHCAAMGDYKDVIEVLLKNDAVYNAVDQLYRQPIELAKNKNVIELLESTDKLIDAVQRNSFSDVQNYIKAGAFVAAKSAKGVNSLNHASCKGYDQVVRVLLQNKANPNVVNDKKLTPLHYAAKFSHLKVVKALLTYNAVYNAVSDLGETPLDFAVDKSIISLFKLITESFKNIENDNTQVIKDLNEIKDTDVVKAVMCARNEENKSLVVAAMKCNFSKVQQLKEIGQVGVSAQISKAIKLLELEHYQQALYMFKNAFKKRENILGSDNPGTLDIQIFIADILHKNGNFQEALNIFEEILQKQTEMLGSKSKDTLKTRNLMASVMHSQGKNEEAFDIYQKVYQIQKEMLGPNHEDTLSTQENMALVLNDQGKHKEALDIFRSIYLNANPKHYQNVLRVQGNMANVLMDQGNTGEALNIYKEMYDEMKVVLGIDNSLTLKTLYNIGDYILHKQREYNKSLAVLKNVLNRQEKVLKPNHPDILKTQCSIKTVFSVQPKRIRALKAYRKVLDHAKDVFASDHPDVLDMLNKIERINFMLKLEGKKPSEILQYLQKDINIAGSKGDMQAIQILLESGSNPNDKDHDGQTPLHCAIFNGHINEVIILLKHGADVTQVTKYEGNTPLHTASSKGYDKIAEILLQHVSSDKLNYFINAKTTSGGATSLHIAAKNGFIDIAMSLLKRGAIYNIANDEGKTPLDLCKDQSISNMLKLVEELFQDAKDGEVEAIKKLKGLKPEEVVAVTNARNNQNYTLLQVVLANKHKNFALQLLEILTD